MFLAALATAGCQARLASSAAQRVSAASAVDALLRHPAVWDASAPLNQPQRSGSPRKKLRAPRHLHLFATDSLFDQFARVIVRAGIMPRKELFETWSADAACPGQCCCCRPRQRVLFWGYFQGRGT